MCRTGRSTNIFLRMYSRLSESNMTLLEDEVGGGRHAAVPTLVSMEQQPRRGRGGRGGGFRRRWIRRRIWVGGGPWSIDFPDSDLNFSFRLQQLTSLKVNPQPIIRRLTAPDLCDYPFLYMIEPGHGISFSPDEAAALRHYLLNGGFLMVDDFWGDREYESSIEQIKSVFPEDKYEPEELPLTHKIFHCVYPLKEKPQVPRSTLGGPGSNVTWETAARTVTRSRSLQWDQRRQRPVDGDHLPQHRPGGRLGA